MCAKHIIKRAVVELTVPSADDAFKTQAVASVFFKLHIYPMIEKILDEIDIKEDIIRLEKFELDFKNFYPDRDNSPGLIKLEQQVREKLKKVIDETRSTGGLNKVVAKNKRVAVKNTKSELFFHILKTGTLPWWAEQDKPILLEELANDVLQNEEIKIRAELVTALQSAEARKRLLRLSEDIIEKVIHIISGQLNKTMKELLSFSENLSGYHVIKRLAHIHALTYSGNEIIPLRSFVAGLLKTKPDMEVAKQFYEQCLKDTFQKNELLNPKTIEIKQALADVNNVYWGKIKKIFTADDVKKYFVQDLDPFNKDVKEKTPTKQENSENKEIHIDKNRNNAKEDISDLILKGDVEAIAKYFKQMEEKASINADSEEINATEEEHLKEYADAVEANDDHYIKNAGLVILNPYLPSFFKELELCDGKKFNSAEAAERAAHLLQYLATNNEDNFEEHDMLLNKILCGIEIEAPFTIDFKITEKERTECKDLLEAVAANWTALKGTSGEGIRDAFFIREGILERQANGWNLKVEKTTIDILIDKLPWGISIISMPWSVIKIFVNW